MRGKIENMKTIKVMKKADDTSRRVRENKQKIKERGISLIVLVITIIIIIILAGAVILSLNNSNVILKAKIAKESNDFVAIREAVENEKTNSMFEGGTSTYSGIVPASYSDEVVVLPSGQITIKAPTTGTTKLVDITNAIEKLDAVYIPAGFVASTVTGENIKSEGLVIKSGSNGAATDQNEFVWVPVENYNSFAKGTMKEAEPANRDNPDPAGNEVEQMYASVKKYKGFYIARYEAADNGSGTVISKKNQYPWNNTEWGYIDYGENGEVIGTETETGVVGKSRRMYSTPNVQTTLVYGVQWNALMNWYNSSGIDTNSYSWGNYIHYRL